MKLQTVGLVVASAVVAAAFAFSCGGSSTPSGKCPATACAMDEMCVTDLGFCAKTCMDSNDCPSHAKNCAAAGGSTTKICQCATTALCGMNDMSTACSETSQGSVCAAKCTGNSDCGAGTCNTSTGECKKGSSDGGPPDGGGGCAFRGCGSGKICNFTSGACEAKSCNSGNQQPDTCTYGTYCSGSSCTEVSEPTCSNFGSGGAPVSWNAKTSTGPIIFKSEEVADDAAFCTTTQQAHTVLLSAYRTDMDWPAAFSGVSGFWYVTTAGTKSDSTMYVRPTSGYTHNGKFATFKVTLCSPAAATFTAGFYFTNGNEFCANAGAGTTGTM